MEVEQISRAQENEDEGMIMLDDSDEEEGATNQLQNEDISPEFAEINFAQHESIFTKIIDKIKAIIPDQAKTCLQNALCLFDVEAAHDKVIAKSLQGLIEILLKQIEADTFESNSIQIESFIRLSSIDKIRYITMKLQNKVDFPLLVPFAKLIVFEEIKVESLTLADKKNLREVLSALNDCGEQDILIQLKVFCQEYCFDEDIGKFYLQLVRHQTQVLVQYLERLKRGGSSDTSLSKLTSQSKKILKKIAFHHFIIGTFSDFRTGRIEFRVAFENCFKLADLDSQMLNDLSVVVLEPSLFKLVSEIDRNAFYGRMTNLKNLCPVQVIISQLKESSNKTNFKLFETALTFHSKSLDLWKLYLVSLKSGLALHKAESVFGRAMKSLNSGEQADLANFYKSTIIDN